MAENILQERFPYAEFQSSKLGGGKKTETPISTEFYFRRIQPKSTVIDANGDASSVEIDLGWTDHPMEYTDYQGIFMRIVATLTLDGSTQMTDANARYPAICWPHCLFNKIENFIQDKNISTSLNPPQDKMVAIRSLYSNEYRLTNFSGEDYVLSTTDRLDLVSSDTTKNYTYKTGDVTLYFNQLGLANSNIILPPGLSHRLVFHTLPHADYKKGIFQGANGDVGTNYQLDLVSFDLYVKTYKVPIVNPVKELSLPLNMLTSTKILIPASTNSTLSFTIPRWTYKIVLGLQSVNVNTSNVHSPTEFKELDADKDKITAIRVSKSGIVMPRSGYTFAITTGSIYQIRHAYAEYISNSQAQNDPSGLESLADWTNLGRLYCFNVSPEKDTDLSVELTFATAPTSGGNNLFVFCFYKNSIKFEYDNRGVIEDVILEQEVLPISMKSQKK